MSGDYSRFPFDPSRDYAGVFLQQGRPLTDWDWNDQTAQANRRAQATTADIFNQAVVPATTPFGFVIEMNAGGLTIGRGRIYVDGLLAENHGAPPSAWDPVLAESYGTAPVGYNDQQYRPDLRDAPPLPQTTAPRLVYLDVWQREITQFEEPLLVEKALGVDTTTRLQTVWQVKILDDIGTGVGCSTPLDAVPGFMAKNGPSSGRLTTGTATVATVPDPCMVLPTGGYRGLENQLYRVEIHQSGPLGTATFKWSRDNGSVVTPVLRVASTAQIVVESTGKDAVLGFKAGDIVEITDDWLELEGTPGKLHTIQEVDNASRTITLATPVDTVSFPLAAADGNLHPERHTRLRRWDHAGKVYTSAGTVYADLASSGACDILVPSDGTSLLLEAGIVVTLGSAVAGGSLRTGDYWTFAARTSGGTVETLVDAPPRGIHHHFAKLAILTDVPSDCRVVWPLQTDADNCACTVCVTPKSHATGVLTIQTAVDMAKDFGATGGGGLVCLCAGVYTLAQPVHLHDVRSVEILGRGPATKIVSAGPAFDLARGGDILLSDFAISAGSTTATAPFFAVHATDVAGLRLEHLFLDVLGPETASAVGVGGTALDMAVRRVRITAPTGIGSLLAAAGSPPAPAGTMGLRVEDNTFSCSQWGIHLMGAPNLKLRAHFRRNRIGASTHAALELGGGSAVGSIVDVSSNEIDVPGSGVIATTGGLRLADNDLLSSAPGQGATYGARLLGGTDSTASSRDWHVSHNRIVGFSVTGINCDGRAGRVLIADNQIEQVSNGITFGGTTAIDDIAVHGNQISDVVTFGIWVRRAQSARISGNSVHRVGAASSAAASRVAILADTVDRLEIVDNILAAIGPAGAFGGSGAGIVVSPSIGCLAVRGNVIRRDGGQSTGMSLLTTDNSHWAALSVGVTGPAAGPVAGTPSTGSGGAQPSGPAAGSGGGSGAGIGVIQDVPVGIASAVVPSVTGPERIVVEGNLFDGRGGTPIVTILTSGDCLFCGNHCLQRTLLAGLGSSPQEIVVQSATIIFGNNRIQGGTVSAALVGLKNVNTPHYTVLGNITSGQIFVGGTQVAPAQVQPGPPASSAATLLNTKG